ncbi:unnamed protein product [Didymodactylos carnosus]|uniref:Uncharacterized protein n=1 Tax=Didymodactylos carnosus TaxID=1234261 RepID=A0A816GTH5_9BILA|nr:unnamed protein product [Didymodactylos carnosus]CAF4673106.1 unnamed protein product [Didymodactylos carnosus]
MTANDLRQAKPIELGAGVPMTSGQAQQGKTAPDSLLAVNKDLQEEKQAAAKAEDRRAESYARMKVALQSKGANVV